MRVERRMGTAVEGRLYGVEIEISRGHGVYVATVDLRGVTVANDVRTLRSARCDELADAIAVIVARVASESLPAGGGFDAEAPPGMDLTELTRRAPEPIALDGTRKWGGGVRALALSGVGAQPGVSVGGELAVYVRRDHLFAEISYASWPGRIDVGLSVAALRMGWGPEQLPLRAWLGAELGEMSRAGVDFHDPDAGSGRWTAIDAGFGVAWPMAKHARLVGTFEVAAPFERTTFGLVDGLMMYEAAVATARCSFGIEVGWR